MNDEKLTPSQRAQHYERHVNLFFPELFVQIEIEWSSVNRYTSLIVFDKNKTTINNAHFGFNLAKEENDIHMIRFLIEIEETLSEMR